MKLWVAVFCFGLFFAAQVPAHAQAFKVPFTFTVGKKVLPPGTYTVAQNYPDSDASWVVRKQSGESAIVITNSVGSPLVDHQTSLVFRRDGGEYSLIEFWQDTHRGRSVIRPKLPNTQIAKSQSDVVVIAALHR